MTTFFDFMTSPEVTEYIEQAWGVGYDTWHSIAAWLVIFFGFASMVVSCIIVYKMATALNKKYLGKRCGIKRKTSSNGDTLIEETTTDYFRKVESEIYDYMKAADIEGNYRGLWPWPSDALELLASIGCEISIRKKR